MTDQKQARGPVQVHSMIRPLVAEFHASVQEALANRGIDALTLFSTKLSSVIGIDLKEDGSRLNGREEEDFVLKKPLDLLFVADGEYGERLVAVDILDVPLGRNDLRLLKVRPLLKRFSIEYRPVPPAAHRGPDRKRAVADIVKAITDGPFRISRREIPERQIETIIEAAKLAEQSGFTCFHEPSLDSIFDVSELWFKQLRENPDYKAAGHDFIKTSRVDAVIATSPPNAYPLVGIEFDGESHRSRSTARSQANDSAKDRIFFIGGVPLIRIDSRDMNPDKIGWRDISVRRVFLKLLIEHLAEISEGVSRTKLNLPASSRQQALAILQPVIGGSRPRSFYSLLSGSLKMATHQFQWCGESHEDAEAEFISADYARALLESARMDSDSFPPGFWTSFNVELEENDILRAKLFIEPGRIMRAAGYTKKEKPFIEELRIQVIGPETLCSGARSLASDTLRLVLCSRAARVLQKNREELLLRYERGIAVICEMPHRSP